LGKTPGQEKSRQEETAQNARPAANPAQPDSQDCVPYPHAHQGGLPDAAGESETEKAAR
jgi:hypothetical protein